MENTGRAPVGTAGSAIQPKLQGRRSISRAKQEKGALIILKTHDKLPYQDQLISDQAKYFSSFGFQWFAHLDYKTPASCHNNPHQFFDWYKPLKLFVRKLSIEEHLQVAGLGVFVNSPDRGYHAHLLLLGKSEQGKTLEQCDPDWWQLQWDEFAHSRAKCPAEIQPLTSQDEITNAAHYCQKKKNGSTELIIINLNLLKKLTQEKTK